MAAYESERSGKNYGHWNSFKEVWYGSHLREIESGKAKLHTITEWRIKLRGDMDENISPVENPIFAILTKKYISTTLFTNCNDTESL